MYVMISLSHHSALHTSNMVVQQTRRLRVLVFLGERFKVGWLDSLGGNLLSLTRHLPSVRLTCLWAHRVSCRSYVLLEHASLVCLTELLGPSTV